MKELSNKEQNAYWNGGLNKSVRLYFYLQRGLALLNEFRYLIVAIIALYALLKMDSPIMLVLMFVISIPVLIVLGWFYTFKMAKIMEFLNIKFSTHYSKYSIELQERQTEALENIDSKIKTEIKSTWNI